MRGTSSSGQCGYSIIEMILAIALFGLIVTIVHTAYNTTSQSYLTAENKARVVQNARSVLATMTGEIRQAGYNASATQVPITVAQAEEIRINADIISTVVHSVTGEPAEDITFKWADSTVVRNEAGGDDLEIGFGITEMTLDYLNNSGTSLLDTTSAPPNVPQCYLSQINVIELNLTVESADSANDRYHQSMTMSSIIKPRNLALARLPYYAEVDTAPPDPVPTVAEDCHTCDQVYLSWFAYNEEAQGDVQGYHLFAEGDYFNNVGSLTPYATRPAGATGDTISGLETGASYYFAVTAFDEIPNENYAVTPSSATATCPPPVAIVITAPAEGDTCSGDVLFTASVVDSLEEVQQVEFRIDGAESGMYADPAAPYRYNGDSGFWETATFPNGEYLLLATALDDLGGSLDADSIYVEVENDICAFSPDVTITSPEDGATISGDVYYTVSASDENGQITQVEFYIDDEYEWTESYDPYYCYGDYSYWNTGSVTDGDHTLHAIAYDNDECTGADTISVYVNNGGGELQIDESYEVVSCGTYDEEWIFGILSTFPNPVTITQWRATWDKSYGRLHRIEIPAGTEVWDCGSSVEDAMESGTLVDLTTYPVISPYGSFDVKLCFWHEDGDGNPGGRENCSMGGVETTQEIVTSFGSFGPHYVYFPCTVNVSGLWVKNQCAYSDYEIAYLEEGDQYYVDRSYVLEDIPYKYQGLPWIKTANDDWNCGGGFRVYFTLNTDATVYVGYDPRDNPANWVVDNMEDTGDSLLVSNEWMEYFTIYEADRSAGTYYLPSNVASGAGDGINAMYVVFFRCKE